LYTPPSAHAFKQCFDHKCQKGKKERRKKNGLEEEVSSRVESVDFKAEEKMGEGARS